MNANFSLLEEARALALELGRNDIADFAATAAQDQSNPLRILVIGEPRSGRRLTSEVILGVGDVIPADVSYLARTIHISWGESPEAEITAPAGATVSFPLAEFGLRTRGFYDYPSQQGLRMHEVALRLPTEMLRSAEIIIESLGPDRPAEEWRRALAQAGFVILVLRAPQLLSEVERNFIREVLQPSFSLTRVALVLNQSDRVEAKDRPELVEYVRTFLGDFESQPVILTLSALVAMRSAQSMAEAGASGADESGAGELMNLVENDILFRGDGIREEIRAAAARFCLAKLEEAVEHRAALLEVEEGALRDAAARLDVRGDRIQKMLGVATNRIELLVRTMALQETLRASEGFSQVLQDSLRADITSSPDVSASRKHAPAYIAVMWNQFMERQTAAAQIRIRGSMEEIVRETAHAIEDLVASGAGLDTSLPGVAQQSINPFMAPKKAKSDVVRATNWMALAGVLVLIPAPPLGAVLIAGSGAVRLRYHDSIREADQNALWESVRLACGEVEIEVKARWARYFEEWSDTLVKRQAEKFREAIQSLRTQLEEAAKSHNCIAEQQEAIRRLRETKLPELKALAG